MFPSSLRVVERDTPHSKTDFDPLVSHGILVVLIVLYALELIFSVDGVFHPSPTTPTLIAFGGLNRAVILTTWEWNRTVTAAFINGSLTALLFNCCGLFLLGPTLERLWGSNRFLVFCFLCALTGSFLSLLVNAPTTTSVGTAGMVTGILTALYISSFALSRSEKDNVQYRVLGTAILLLWPIVNGIHQQMGIFNYASHLGGILMAILSTSLVSRTKRGSREARFLLTSKSTLAVLVLFGAAFAVVVIRYPAYANAFHALP